MFWNQPPCFCEAMADSRSRRSRILRVPQAASECHQQPTQEQQGNDRPGKSKHLDAKGGIDAIIVKVASGLDVRGSVHGSCGSSKDEGKTRKEGNNGRTNAGAEGKG